jgi:hypothetical protein
MELAQKILEQVTLGERAGGRYSTSALAKRCGTGYRRMKKCLFALNRAGYLTRHTEGYRPNVDADRWGTTDAGDRLLYAMWGKYPPAF